jgi:hypothetical protein
MYGIADWLAEENLGRKEGVCRRLRRAKQKRLTRGRGVLLSFIATRQAYQSTNLRYALAVCMHFELPSYLPR